MELLNSKYFKIAIWVLIIFLIILLGSQISFIFSPIVIIFETLFLPIVITVFLYYLLSPIVIWLQQRKISRTLSVIFIYSAFLFSIFLLVSFFAPSLQKQILSLVENFPDILEELGTRISSLEGTLLIRNFYNGNELLVENAREWMATVISDAGLTVGSSIYASLTTIRNIVLGLIIAPMMLFYTLKEGDRFSGLVTRYFPKEHKGEVQRVLFDMDKALTSFIQGQVIVSLLVGILIYIGFLIIGLEYALLLALVAVFTNWIPYLGPIVGTIPALIVAMIISPFMVLKTLIVVVVAQQIESQFITPQIMGRKLDLHPLSIIIVLVLAGRFFGLVGVILGVPGYVLLKVIFSHFYILYKLRKNSFQK